MAITYNTNIVRTGLVLHLDAANPKSYPGTGTTWYDISGSGNNGTLVNGVGYNSSVTGGMTFDGVNDYVSFSNITMASTGATASAWINITDFNLTGSGKNAGINSRIFLNNSTNQGSAQIALYSGGYGFETNTNSNPYEIAGRTSPNVSASGIATATWFNFSLVFDTGVAYGYVNGSLVSSIAIADNLTINRLGDQSINVAYPGYLKGTVRNLQIYSRALSATEILKNFTALRGRYGL